MVESPRAPQSVTVLGEQVAIPVEVRSARMVNASFTVPATAAQRLIEPTGLKIKRMAGTLGLASISAVAYTDNDLGPYHEIALAFVVDPHDGASQGSMATGQVTTYIHRLPVNQEFTCAAGRDIWGFPKWVCDISYVERGRRTEVVMRDEGELVLALTLAHSPIRVPASEMEMQCYSHRDNILRRTPWTMQLSDVSLRPAGAKLELGDRHPMAAELRDLGFPKPAMMTQRAGQVSCTFGTAEVCQPAASVR